VEVAARGRLSLFMVPAGLETMARGQVFTPVIKI
jgi:hypothetical protein